MRGTLHLLPLYVSSDNAESGAGTQDALHPIPVDPTAADALQLDAPMASRLTTILASVQSDIAARSDHGYTVDLQKLQQLPVWAQDIVRSGCFEGGLNKNAVFQHQSLQEASTGNGVHKRAPSSGGEMQSTKRARSLTNGDLLSVRTEPEDSDADSDDAKMRALSDSDECPLWTLFTREERVAGTVERYSEQLSQLLEKLQQRQQSEAFEHDGSDLLTSAEVKALFQTLKIMHKHEMIGKMDPDLLFELMKALDKQVLRGMELDILGTMSLRSGDVDEQTPGINARLIARMRLCVDVSLCELLVMSAREIDRRVLSEELISNCIQLFSHILQRLIVPCIDVNAATVAAAAAAATGAPRKVSIDERDSDSSSPQSKARQRQRRSSASANIRANREIRSAITPLINVACEFIEQLSRLLLTVKLADRWILHFSSSMVELFLLEHSTHAASLQQSAKAVLRGIFLQYDAHRALILDDIVGVMKKLPTSKRHLRTVKLLDASDSVQMISTLVVAIVQASASIREVESERARNTADPTLLPAHVTEDSSEAEVKPFQLSLEDTRESASMFVRALMQGCLKKHEERDHRVVLENFLEDLLVLFVRPEWAGAEVLLEALSSSLASILHANVVNDAKKLESQHALTALNLVGKICTSIKKHQNTAALDLLHEDVDARAVLEEHMRFLNERMHSPSSANELSQLDLSTSNLVMKHALVVSMRNCTQASVTQDDSRRLLLARFVIATCSSSELQPDKTIELSLWRSFWRNSAQSVSLTSKLLSPSSTLAQRLSLQLVVARDFCCLFGKLLAHVMSLLSKGIPSFRARVLKVLATVVDVDPMLMTDSGVKAAVHRCFMDEATSVRQAAVDLVGRHVSLQPVLFERYFDMLAERLRDRGISVRKSVCKIFRAFLMSSSTERRERSALSEGDLRHKSACMRSLVERIGDPSEDRVVKNFIIDTFQEVWFGSELLSRRLSTLVGDFADDGTAEQLPPGWKTVKAEVKSGNASTQPADSRQVEFVSPDGRVFRSLSDAWIAYRTPQIMPASVVQSKRSKSDDTPELVATIIEVIHDMANLDWFVALLRRLLFENGREQITASGAVRSSNDRADEVKIAKERSEKIVEHLVECLLQLEEGTPLTGVTIADEHSQFLACMKTLSAFCEARPLLLQPRLELIMIHLKGDDNLPKAVESRVQSLVLSMVDHVFAHMKRIPERLVRRLESDVKALVFRAPPSVVGPSIKCLATVSRTTRKPPVLMLMLLDKFYAYLLKYKDLESLASIPADVSSSLQRALFATGQIGGAIDLDACVFPANASITNLAQGAIMDALFEMFARFLRMPGNAMCAAKATQGLGFLFLTRTRLLLQAQQDGILAFLLSEAADELKLQCLASLVELLQFEERRLELGVATQRMNKAKSKSEQVQGDQEADAALIGSVMQAQIQNILALAVDASVRIRSEAIACIDMLLVQGLVSPLHCIPVLVALETDQVVSIRDVAHSQLVALHGKFPSLLNTAVVPGIQASHAFQLRAFGSSAVFTLDKDKREYCLLGRLYAECIRTTRKHRHLFLKALVNQFADSGGVLSPLLSASSGSDTKPHSNIDVKGAAQYLCYVAQLLCALPFEVEDEPLFVIYWINRYATLKLSSVLDRVRDLFARAGLAPDIMMDDATDFSDVDVTDYLPSVQFANDGDDASALQHACLVGFAISVLLRVKLFLKDRYLLESEKCMTYQPANASKATDESVVQSERVPRLRLSPSLTNAAESENVVEASWILFVQTWEAARDDQREMDVEVQEDVAAKLRKRKSRRRTPVAAKQNTRAAAADDGEDEIGDVKAADNDDDEFVEGFAD